MTTADAFSFSTRIFLTNSSGDRNLQRKKTVAALGNFDGVHKGHMELIKKAVETAEKMGAKSMLYTFGNHPAKVLNPDANAKILTSKNKKEKIAKENSIDTVYFETFTAGYAAMSPEEFVKKILVEKLNASAVVTGFNYTFGAKGSGDTEMLKTICGKYGIDVYVIPQVVINGNTVSSSFLRKLVSEGNVSEYPDYTGRMFSVSGKVVGGKHLGRSLGFPTANIVPEPDICLPSPGVYITETDIGGKTVHGITNVGSNPTFDEKTTRIETFLFDFSGDLYGDEIEVFFIKKTRDEIKFAGSDELAERVKLDIAGGMRYFEERKDSGTDIQ